MCPYIGWLIRHTGNALERTEKREQITEGIVLPKDIGNSTWLLFYCVVIGWSWTQEEILS